MCVDDFSDRTAVGDDAVRQRGELDSSAEENTRLSKRACTYRVQELLVVSRHDAVGGDEILRCCWA